ncbi:MAG: enolase C-terminal domain-like protein [Mycobacteriales bacterium]
MPLLLEHTPRIRLARRRVVAVTLRKKDPKWRFALGARPLSEGVVVDLESEDGVHGYGWVGEIQHLGHDLESVRAATYSLVESVSELSTETLLPLFARLEEAAAGRRPALSGVESAVLDLIARTQGVPVHALFGGTFRSEIPVLRILGIKEPDEMAVNAQKLRAEGYRHIKVKIDNDPSGVDAERIRAIRSAVGPDVRLTLDANQSYDARGACALYEQISDQRIDVFEQPVPAKDWEGLRQVSDALDCIVEADESADSMPALLRLAGTGACTGISLKLLKLGGLRAVLHAARVCRDAGIHTRLGAHVGSQLLAAAALQAAVAVEDISFACELAEFARLDDDPFEGLTVEGGVIRLGSATGLGVRLLDGALTT